MSIEKTYKVSKETIQVQLSKGSYYFEVLDPSVIVEYSLNNDLSNSFTVLNAETQFTFKSNTTIYFRAPSLKEGKEVSLYINDYKTKATAPLKSPSMDSMEITNEWRPLQLASGSYFFVPEAGNKLVRISLSPDGTNSTALNRGGEQLSFSSATTLYVRIASDVETNGKLKYNTINVIAATGEGGGGGTGPGVEYTFSAPLSTVGSNVTLNYKSDLTLKDNSLTLNLKVNEDFRALETVVEELKRPASDTNKGLVQIGDETQLAITMDGILTFNTTDDGYLKSTFVQKSVFDPVKQQVETNKSDIATLKLEKADKTQLNDYTLKSLFDETVDTKVNPTFQWMTENKVKYDGYELRITTNEGNITVNTEAIAELRELIKTVGTGLTLIGQINKSYEEVTADKDNLLNAFVQEKKQRAPKEGDIVWTNDFWVFVFVTDAWTNGARGTITYATTQTAGLVKLKDEFGYLVADPAGDGLVKVKGIETLALKTDVTQEIETAKQTLTLEINKKANSEDVYTKVQADEKFVTKESQATVNQQVETNKQNIQTNQTNITKVSNELGTIAELTTTDKSSVVNAINEVKTSIDSKVSNETYQADKQQLTQQIQAVDAKAEKNKEDIGTLNTTVQGIQNNKLDKTEADGKYVKAVYEGTNKEYSYIRFNNTATDSADNGLYILRSIEAKGEKKDIVLFKQADSTDMSNLIGGWKYQEGVNAEQDIFVFDTTGNKLNLSVYSNVLNFKQKTKISNIADGVEANDAVNINQLTLVYNELNDKISQTVGGLTFVGQDTQHTAKEFLTSPSGELLFDNFVRANTQPPRGKQKGDIVMSSDGVNILWNGTALVRFGATSEIQIASTSRAGIVKAGTEDGQLSVSRSDGLAKVNGFDEVKQKAADADTKSKLNETRIGSMTTEGVAGATLTDKINSLKTMVDGKLDSATYNIDKGNFAQASNVYTKSQADNKFATKTDLTLTDSNIGTLNNLTTTNKNSLVEAVNEVDGKVKALPNIDNIAKLDAENKFTGVNYFYEKIDVGGILEVANKMTFGGVAASITPVANNAGTLKFYDTTTGANCYYTLDLGTKGRLTGLRDPITDTDAISKGYANSNYASASSLGTLGNLTTTAKDNIVAAVNEVNGEVDEAKQSIQSNAQSIAANTQSVVDINRSIGELTNLNTTAKDNLVNAINEINNKPAPSNMVTTDTTQDITAQKTFTATTKFNGTTRGLGNISLGSNGDSPNYLSFVDTANNSTATGYLGFLGTGDTNITFDNKKSNGAFEFKQKVVYNGTITDTKQLITKEYVDTNALLLNTEQVIPSRKIFSARCYYKNSPVNENYGQFLIVDENTENKRAFIAFASNTAESYKFLYGRFGIIGGNMIMSVADQTKSIIADVKMKYQKEIPIDEDLQLTTKKYVDQKLSVVKLNHGEVPDSSGIPDGSVLLVVN